MEIPQQAMLIYQHIWELVKGKPEPALTTSLIRKESLILPLNVERVSLSQTKNGLWHSMKGA